MTLRLVALLGSFVLMFGHHQAAQADGGRLNVVELFTSQACEKCPPADTLLKRFATRTDVMALSLPVDYWDYLGWKDTLASPKFALRQRAYAANRGDGEVYTPQVVVNGLLHIVGSHAEDIDRAIVKSRETLSAQHVAVRASAGKGMLTIAVAARPEGSKVDMATVWIAVVQPEVSVEIKHGENRGKVISYVNVVREITAVGAWIGSELNLELPQSALMKPGERCAVLIQAGEGGRILGATWVKSH